ncbi:MAG: hypothetical protein N2504_06455 [candidate division WOR-3 bacterium]|nr:hypothetical protein [candidate division WOR-3 bacterium]MCX7948210.1 hypothetical protein [candidate division WOR-3 bacterium]MDW8150012.1 hypothetical protein [candidate division WOR-3 bacterium]
MLWILAEIRTFVGDTISFESKVIKVIPKEKAYVFSNSIIPMKPGRAIVITENSEIPIFIAKLKKIKLPYDSLILNVGDSIELNFGNYKYEIRPKLLGNIQGNKLFIISPGRGILIAKTEKAIGKIKIIAIVKNKKEIKLDLFDKIVLDMGERRVFSGYKIISKGDKIKAISDTIEAIKYGIEKVRIFYESKDSYGYKDVIVIVKPKFMEIISKTGDKVKIGNTAKIVFSKGDVIIKDSFLYCQSQCYGIIRLNGRLVPFLFHKDAYKESEEKDFLIIENSFNIPKPLEVLDYFPKRKIKIINNKIIVKEKGLAFLLVKTEKGITIIKIIATF